MAELVDQPAKAPKKKKTLAFLRSTPKPAPPYDDDFDSDDDHGKNHSKEGEDEDEDDDDALDMFRRSKDFFPFVVKEQEKDMREVTPKSHTEVKEHTAEESDSEDPIPSSSRSSKRRRLASPAPETDHPWRAESYDELYGPATPLRRATNSPTLVTRKSPRKQPTPASAGRIKQAPPSTGKSEHKGRQTADLVQSDLLRTPISRSNSHQQPANVIALDNDDDDGGHAVTRTGSWIDHTPSPKEVATKTGFAKKEQAPLNPIVLDDSDDDDDFLETVSKPEDDEFAHFVAAARKKQEAAKAAAAALASFDDSSDSEKDPLTPNAARAHSKKRVPFIPVKIFVHSRIAAYADYDMRGFGCQRKLDQELGPVRGAFVQYLRKKGVPVSEEMNQAIFLTWKGRRIYNSVSGLGLGWQPQGNGKIYAPEREPGFTNGGVLLEAWTEEDFEHYMADQDRQRLIDRGELKEGGTGVEIDDGAEEEAEPEVAKVRLFLKGKDTEAIRLTSYLDTQVRVLVGAYRKQKKVPEDREIKLRHEGEWLDPDMTVEQADIDDMCTVEVYLK